MNDSIAKCIVALRLTVVVKVSTCLPAGTQSGDLQCSGKGRCITKPSEVRRVTGASQGSTEGEKVEKRSTLLFTASTNVV